MEAGESQTPEGQFFVFFIECYRWREESKRSWVQVDANHIGHACPRIESGERLSRVTAPLRWFACPWSLRTATMGDQSHRPTALLGIGVDDIVLNAGLELISLGW